MEIIVFTDGSCLNNGKPDSAAGYGIHYPNKEHPDVGRPFNHPPMTNQRAELYAIYKALKTTTKENYTKIKLYSDSDYSMKCLTQWASNWEKNGWVNAKKKPVKNQDLLKPLYKLYKKPKNKTRIVFFHVKAHTGKNDFYSIGNAEADRLAVQGSNRHKNKSKTKRKTIKIEGKSQADSHKSNSEKEKKKKSSVKVRAKKRKKQRIIIK